MQIDLVELAALAIGSLFIAIGAAAAAVGLSARPRANRSVAWFAVFCVLYGLRLVASSEPLQVVTQWPETFFQYAEGFVTYTILVPATLFVESLVGPGKYAILRRVWQVLTVCAVGAILADLSLGRPHAAMALNPPMVVMTIAVWFAHLADRARQGRWSVEVRAVAGAGALLALTALYETISDRSFFDPVDAEPLAMLVFAAALGWFVLTRAREQEL